MFWLSADSLWAACNYKIYSPASNWGKGLVDFHTSNAVTCGSGKAQWDAVHGNRHCATLLLFIIEARKAQYWLQLQAFMVISCRLEWSHVLDLLYMVSHHMKYSIYMMLGMCIYANWNTLLLCSGTLSLH